MKGTSLSWVVGLWLFLAFLLIVINLFSYKINLYLQENRPSKVEVRNPKYIYEIDVEFDPNYVFFCNKDNLKEFCEHFPIFIPTNFPFLPNYGTFNNTVGEYFKIKNFGGIFFIVNISDSIPKTNYMLVKVCNNENRNLTDVQIRIPIYYLAYQGIDKIKVNDTKENKLLPFCYEYRNLECKDEIGEENNWNYHIWVKLNLSANECKILNISEGDNEHAVDGSKIFDYYFTKFKVKCKKIEGLFWYYYYECNLTSNDVLLANFKTCQFSDNKGDIINLTLQPNSYFDSSFPFCKTNPIIHFNTSIFQNNISDFYIRADNDFYVNNSFSFKYPSSSSFSWYTFYDLRNITVSLKIWFICYTTLFAIDTIRIRKKANVTVEIIYPKIIKKYYLILGEKPEEVSGITVEKNYITNNHLKVYFSNDDLKEDYISYVTGITLWYYLDNVNPSKLIFNRSNTFAYANYSNIFIILPPNSHFTIIYNLTRDFWINTYISERERDTNFFEEVYNNYTKIWQGIPRKDLKSTEFSNNIVLYDSDWVLIPNAILYLFSNRNKSFYYIFYGTNFNRETVEKIIEYFKFPKVQIEYVADP